MKPGIRDAVSVVENILLLMAEKTTSTKISWIQNPIAYV